ncbi:MAG: hypothetical protein FWD47_10260 [Treponema sp.]|nr:hypothetical protein [Treponema sp.]
MPMYTLIKFNQSALKRGYTEADIMRCFETFIYEDPLEDADNKYLLIGFDLKGNLLEIMYNKIDDDSINVFHAMPCRNAYIELI